MDFDTLTYVVRDGMARITLNRPDAGNALDLQMSKDLMYAALAADEDPSVRVVVLGANGKLFCAGGDLAAFRDAGDRRPALIKEMTTYLHAGISRLARMAAPVVASVRGAAAGAGMSLVCAADLVVCGESAKFAMAYTAAGLTPDGGSTYSLPRLLGTRRTLELMLTNRRIDATTALEWGLVTQVVPDEELAATTDALAARLASGATAALASAKRLVLGSFDHSLESQMELESRAISDAARTADAAEGIAAFLEKRPPKFTGR